MIKQMNNRMRKICLLVLALCVFSSNHSSYAMEKQSIPQTDTEPLLYQFDLYDTVSYQEISEIIYDNVAFNEEKYHVEVLDDILPLYDINLLHYAYYVPVLINSSQYGYYVIALVNDIYTIMESATNDNGLYDRLCNFSQDTRILYRFPLMFIVNQADAYHLLTEEDAFVDVSDSITEFSSNGIINNLYKNSINKEMSTNRAIPSSYSTALSFDDTFVPVINGGETYYGGNQAWLAVDGYISKYYADRSCGVTAAANTAYHLSRFKTGKYDLYSDTCTREKFVSKMYEIYQYLTPEFYGIPGIDTMKAGFEEYAASTGVAINGYISDASWTKENTIDYIRDGLSIDSPVLMIIWNSKIQDLKWHWVTITKIYRNNGGANMIAASSWGNKYEYNYDVWFDDFWVLYQGLIYFE